MGERLTGMAIATLTAVSGAGALTACGDDRRDETPVVTMGAFPNPDGSTPESATTTTTSPELGDSFEDLLARLEAAGYDPELAREILAVGEMPLNNPEDCIDYVADAKGGEAQATAAGWLIKSAGGEVVINTDMFATAGEGIIANNGGPNQFTDSVADDFQEGVQRTPQEVADYFGDPTKIAERTQEAVQELYASSCGDPYELASNIAATANARLAGTDVRLGEIFKGALSDYVIDGEVTPEALTLMAQQALDKYVIEYPAGIDTKKERDDYLVGNTEEAQKRIDAYNKQLEDASKLISVLLNFMPYINTETTRVDMSSQIFGTNDNNYPELIFSDTPIDATGRPHGLGGEYTAIKGSLLEFFGKFKAGCVAIENGALVFNLLDGRAGYAYELVSAPEGCEPIEIVVNRRPEVEVPVDSIPIAGGGAGGEEDDDNNVDNNTTKTSLSPTTSTVSPGPTITVNGDGNDNGYTPVP